MEDNIIQHAGGTVIINGGNPLPGCPNDWEEAKNIELSFNNGVDRGVDREDDDYSSSPRWSFDCGFKLDFDGPLMRVSSRFYPPKTHYGATWDGTVHVYFLNRIVEEKKFDCQTLNDLQKEVEAYVKTISDRISAAFLPPPEV